MTKRLSRPMTATVKRLDLSPDRSGYVNMYTAYALEDRGLVSIASVRERQRTGGGQFPERWATLTDEGKAYAARLP